MGFENLTSIQRFTFILTTFIYEVSSIENSKESLENTRENTIKHDQISRDWNTIHCSVPLLHHLSYRGKGILRTVLQNTEAMCATFFLRRKRSVQETTLPVDSEINYIHQIFASSCFSSIIYIIFFIHSYAHRKILCLLSSRLPQSIDDSRC